MTVYTNTVLMIKIPQRITGHTTEGSHFEVVRSTSNLIPEDMGVHLILQPSTVHLSSAGKSLRMDSFSLAEMCAFHRQAFETATNLSKSITWLEEGKFYIMTGGPMSPYKSHLQIHMFLFSPEATPRLFGQLSLVSSITTRFEEEGVTPRRPVV